MSASLASLDSCTNGRRVLSVVCSLESSGRYTSLYKVPV